MSSEALAWSFKQDVKPSSVKFTLVALCECANYKTGKIFPSIEHLTEITGQNRKTIISNIAALEALGFIKDTGERVGLTKQIKVYQATLETVPKTEQSLKRNSTENGRKQSQKRDTEPSKEPSSSKTTSSKNRAPVCPDDVGEQIYRDFLQHRKDIGHPLSETALLGIRREAENAGWKLSDALVEMMVRGWRGFKAEWVKEKASGTNIQPGGQQGPDKRSGFAKALDRRIASV